MHEFIHIMIIWSPFLVAAVVASCILGKHNNSTPMGELTNWSPWRVNIVDGSEITWGLEVLVIFEKGFHICIKPKSKKPNKFHDLRSKTNQIMILQDDPMGRKDSLPIILLVLYVFIWFWITPLSLHWCRLRVGWLNHSTVTAHGTFRR